MQWCLHKDAVWVSHPEAVCPHHETSEQRLRCGVWSAALPRVWRAAKALPPGEPSSLDRQSDEHSMQMKEWHYSRAP